MDESKQPDMIKALCEIIKDQQRRENELINTIKELVEENAKLKRKHSIFRKLFM